jgi:ABC-type phosphate/phosphonate transport system substrate-binding protein
LKPGNIIVDRDGQPHLTDFGLAKMMAAEAEEPTCAPLTVSGTALGTPSYMSPEQGAGRGLSRASDIYSLGAILYEMLVGTPPFRSGTPLETLRLAAEQEAKRPSGINPRIDKDLDTICIKCLEKDPGARYTSAEALAEDLERWLRQEPIHARPASIGLRVRRWVARNRVGTALILSLCVGLAVALVLLKLALVRQNKLDLLRANSVQRFSRGVEEMWKDKELQSVLIGSTDLAELADLPPRRSEPGTTRLTLGISINHDPNEQAIQYAPFLRSLERRMEKALHHPIRIDLRLYKAEADSIRDAGRDKLDVQRMGALSYVLAKQMIPGLEPVVRERTQKEAVIFAGKGTGITKLAEVAGKRVAFGQTNSAVSFWAKVQLRRAGIRKTDLQSCVHLTGTKQSRDENPARPKGSEDRDSEVQAHKQVIQEIFLGRADVGEAPRRYFELFRYRRQGLVPLLSYQITSDIYVARPGLEPEVVRALRESLVSFQGREEKELLAKFSHNVVVDGFEAAADDDFKDIRSAMSNEVAAFESSPSSETPKTPPANSR